VTHPPGIRRTLRLPWRTARQLAEDVDDELAFHMARKAEELIEAGLPPDIAREKAAKAFGDLEYTRQYCRDEDVRRERESRQMNMVQEIKQDLVYAFRSLRSAPGFALVALLTLGLGIGANTAIFSVVRGVLLQPLPFPDADRVVRVWQANRSANELKSTVSEPDFLDWRANTRTFATLGGYWYARGSSGTRLIGVGDPEYLEGAYVTPGFFETLRAPALIGRPISADEHVNGRDRVILLSHGLWQRRFGSDPNIVGRTLPIDGAPYTVIGVMQRGFTFPAERLDFWIPLSTIPADGIGRGRDSRFIDVVGRLAPGATLAQAHDELTSFSRRLAAQFPQAKGWDEVTTMPVREALLGDVRRPLLVLLGAVAFVLLITCVNIAGLLLARATARQTELAVRSAIGAGRTRLIRQLVTESLVLAIAGGIIGIALAYAGVRALGMIGASELPRASSIRIDAPVLLYALGISTLAGLLFGLLPALRATSANLQGMLRAGSRGSVGGGGHKLRSALVVAEVALAVVLIAGAGLAAKSFARLMGVDPGFQADNVLALKLSVDSDKYDKNYNGYQKSLLDAISAVPGVKAVGAAKNFPLRGAGEARAPVVVPGTQAGAPEQEVRVPVMHVSADYFKAMGIPLRAGRTFTTADDTSAPPVWIVNEAFAKRYFPNENVVGKTVTFFNPVQIIGVVGDIRQISLTDPAIPYAYIHYLQNRRSGMSIAIRTDGDPRRYIDRVRQAIWGVDRDQTITSVETMSSIIADSTARPRLLASLLVLFGLIGLSLGALGIYGVRAYTVSQRRQEIGVRVALGATPSSVLSLVLRQGMTLAIIGVVVGVAGAFALTRLMTAVLYEVGANDAQTFALVVVVLLTTALIASWLPARRALRIDPVQALRYD
jgi:predicted permease